MEISLLTPKCTLVPADFIDRGACREILGEVAIVSDEDEVICKDIPQFHAVLIYAFGSDSTRIVNEEIISDEDSPQSEMYFILRDLNKCPDYNKILCTWAEGHLYMAIAQGRTLLLANTYASPDFTTAQYFIFMAMKSLQLNPEVSTIYWRHPISKDSEMSLYHYFKSVDNL